MSLNVLLPTFEGPLGLLLYLIRKEEMNILDINIHQITRQYLDHIKLMRELDLEVASDFIFMASTLIQIKSRFLLPQYNEEGEVVESEDPRRELVQKLLEYQRFQEAAKKLQDRPWLGRDVWARGMPQDFHDIPINDQVVIEENGLFSLIASYRNLMRRIKNKVHEVTEKVQSVANRILELGPLLKIGERVILRDLITATENRSRQLLITFLSLLELGKLGFVSLYQTEPYSDLWIDLRRPIETDIISSVEEYTHVESGEFEMNPAEFVTSTLTGESNEVEVNGTVATDEEILQAEREDLEGEPDEQHG